MRVFWAGGAQPDRADDSGDGHTALMAAAHHGHVNTVRALLEGGADPTLRTTDGLTARQIAVRLEKTFFLAHRRTRNTKNSLLKKRIFLLK